MLRLAHYLIIALLIGNALLTKDPLVGTVTFAIAIGLQGYVGGIILFPKLRAVFQFIFGTAAIAAIYAILLTPIFYLYALTWPVLLIVFLLVSGYLLLRTPKNLTLIRPQHKKTVELVIWQTLYIIMALTTLAHLWQGSSLGTITSPWEQVGSAFWLSLLTTLVLLLILNTKNRSHLQTLNISIFYFIVLNVANIIYRIGFGFDSFIHQATEQLILNEGTFLPKPPYYIGHYSLATLVATLTHLPVTIIDRLMPLAFIALTLPAAVMVGVGRFLKTKSTFTNMAALVPLLISFPLLSNPTPQALSIGFLLIIIFLAMANHSDRSVSFGALLIFAFAAFFIHPLSGIPAFIFLFFVLLHRWRGKLALAVKIMAGVAAGFSFLVAFWLGSAFAPIERAAGGVNLSFLIPFPFVRQYHFLLDLLYTAGNSVYPILIVSALVCAYLLYSKKTHTALWIWLGVAVILMINYFSLSLISFGNIISYEQQSFPLRISALSFYFLLPPAIWLLAFLKPKTTYQKFFVALTLVIFITSATYLSYPRSDDYQNSHLLNVSQHDLRTVAFINTLANEYVVLGNQMTSAAAVKTFGFGRTLTTEEGEQIYFYPIPTSGKLYEYYIRLLEREDPLTVTQEVKKYTGRNAVYITLNREWSNFGAIDQKLREQAISVWDIDGQIVIYLY